MDNFSVDKEIFVIQINAFHTTGLFLYPLKTSEKL